MRILILDDDAIVCQSLATILSAQGDIEVVATCTEADQAVRRFDETLPDVALLDIRMPGDDGITAARAIRAAHPDARVVFLTTFSDDEYVKSALALGARGYLIKQDVEKIAPALRSVMAGQCVLEGAVLERATSGDLRARVPDERALAMLSAREVDVVRLVADGLANAEIAACLCLSEGTVRNHISAALAKLGVQNRTQLAVYYHKHCR